MSVLMGGGDGGDVTSVCSCCLLVGDHVDVVSHDILTIIVNIISISHRLSMLVEGSLVRRGLARESLLGRLVEQ